MKNEKGVDRKVDALFRLNYKHTSSSMSLGARPNNERRTTNDEPFTMPELILTREQSRLVDALAIERYGMTGLVLMENAGRGAAEIIRRTYIDEHRSLGRVVICCGKGNNGGDGFVVARHLDNARIPIRILLFADPAKLTGDAAANYEIARRAELPIEVFNPAYGPLDETRLSTSLAYSKIIVDALLGTGTRGEPLPPLTQVIDMINKMQRRRIAIDIPSGLDCDTGEPATHTIRADQTLTFVSRKPGFLQAAAQEYLGKVQVVDIGVPRKLLEELSSESV